MGMVINNLLQNIEIFLKNTKYEEFKIVQLEFNPKINDRIYINFDVHNCDDINQQSNNLFSQFLLTYIYVNLEKYLIHYKPEIMELLSKNNITYSFDNVIQQYSNFILSFKKIKQNGNSVLLIDYAKEDINEFDKRDSLNNSLFEIIEKNIQVLTHIIRKQSQYMNQLYFYIYPMFTNWMYNEKISFEQTDKWFPFFEICKGW